MTDELYDGGNRIITERCAENLTDGTSSHDWPVTNLATGQVAGLCWFCGSSAESFYERWAEHRRNEAIFYGVNLKIGLRQQGHIPTVERMLAEGATWDEIGRAIGWHGPTVQRWYEMDQSHQKETAR